MGYFSRADRIDYSESQHMLSRLFLLLGSLLATSAVHADEKKFKDEDFKIRIKPAVADKNDTELHRLQKERYNSLLEVVQLQMLRIEAGKDPLILVGDTIQRAVTAGLDFQMDPRERMALIEESIRWAKLLEMLTRLGVEAGSKSAAELSFAKAIRLDVEIRLVQERELQRKKAP